MPLDRFHHYGAAAAAQHAGRRRADLDKVLANRAPVVHRVECGDLVDAHGRHFEDSGDFVHDGDGGEAVLALAEVQEGHHGRFLVLRWVALDDLVDEALVLGGEFEGDGGVVVVCIPVLDGVVRVGFSWG